MQALYAVARAAGAVVFESNVRCSFQNGSDVITEKLYGLPLIPDNTVVTQDSLAMGFDCGAPPEPLVGPWAYTRNTLTVYSAYCTSLALLNFHARIESSLVLKL